MYHLALPTFTTATGCDLTVGFDLTNQIPFWPFRLNYPLCQISSFGYVLYKTYTSTHYRWTFKTPTAKQSLIQLEDERTRTTDSIWSLSFSPCSVCDTNNWYDFVCSASLPVAFSVSCFRLLKRCKKTRDAIFCYFTQTPSIVSFVFNMKQIHRRSRNQCVKVLQVLFFFSFISLPSSDLFCLPEKCKQIMWFLRFITWNVVSRFIDVFFHLFPFREWPLHLIYTPHLSQVCL